ncbi:hypothetical protein SLEP1_g27730 [Rubroshorea leprosula]|uniref:Uncharacterized protein n=1 Tax=Rubroshorea leprosula TaxID=152421 RepID=A0AAV5JRH1_9ROSI|nr:hypothetical protein SLEP1_g27730 [Rubroshorea leprosula]
MPWKTGEKAWFLAFFSCSRTQIEPRNSPPLLENPDLLCSVRRLLLLWGQIAWVLARELSSSMPPAFPLQLRFLQLENYENGDNSGSFRMKFKFPMVPSVSIEIESSVYASEPVLSPMWSCFYNPASGS